MSIVNILEKIDRVMIKLHFMADVFVILPL